MCSYVNMERMTDCLSLIAAGASPRKAHRWLAPAAITICVVHLFCGYVRAQDAATRPVAHVDHKGLVKLGWQLACQAQTFHDRSAVEMMLMLHEQNIHHIELAPGQVLLPDHPDIKIVPGMAADDVDTLMNQLKASHLDVVSYGVANLTSDQAQARKLFELAGKLKAKNIVASPPPDALEMLDGLANEYRINLAVVNGAKPEAYWGCDAMLAVLNGRSARIGVCADIANWRRSGLQPVQCLAKLAGHVIEVHLSDVNDQGQEVPLGAGGVGLENVLSSFKQQNFKGIFAIQYNSGAGGHREANFIASVNAFSDQVTRLASVGQ
jgi:sugar phosphate isomerase/epimerase